MNAQHRLFIVARLSARERERKRNAFTVGTRLPEARLPVDFVFRKLKVREEEIIQLQKLASRDRLRRVNAIAIDREAAENSKRGGLLYRS